jgi:hypothetical protein
MTNKYVDAAAHNDALATALAGMPNDDSGKFTLETIELIEALVDQTGLRPVKFGGREYRALVLLDPRNAFSLRRDERLEKKWIFALPRDFKNPALYNRDILVLNEILYLPVQIMKWFRPTIDSDAANGNQIRFGCGMNLDPRAKDFTNNSNITSSIVLGAGALRRGRRYGEVKFTSETGRHGDGLELAVRYDDGWMRNEWYSKDDRGEEEMFCDSSFTVFNYDTGPSGVSI